jgi:hypothetical protein
LSLIHAEQELAKLKEDLNVVLERVKLCREMLPNSPGIGEDEALAEVVGFLEACKPRMVSQPPRGDHTSGTCTGAAQGSWLKSPVRASGLQVEIIQAGTQGVLTEELLELSLKVNDELLKTLEAERTGQPLPVDDDTPGMIDDYASWSIRSGGGTHRPRACGCCVGRERGHG